MQVNLMAFASVKSKNVMGIIPRSILSIQVLSSCILGMNLIHDTTPFICAADISPGRFFSINEIKLMLAFTLLRFDVKTIDRKRPSDAEFNVAVFPDMKAELF